MKSEAEPYVTKMIAGSCKDFEEYRHYAGIVKGLLLAEQVLHDTIKRLADRQEVNDD